MSKVVLKGEPSVEAPDEPKVLQGAASSATASTLPVELVSGTRVGDSHILPPPRGQAMAARSGIPPVPQPQPRVEWDDVRFVHTARAGTDRTRLPRWLCLPNAADLSYHNLGIAVAAWAETETVVLVLTTLPQVKMHPEGEIGLHTIYQNALADRFVNRAIIDKPTLVVNPPHPDVQDLMEIPQATPAQEAMLPRRKVALFNSRAHGTNAPITQTQSAMGITRQVALDVTKDIASSTKGWRTDGDVKAYVHMRTQDAAARFRRGEYAPALIATFTCPDPNHLDLPDPMAPTLVATPSAPHAQAAIESRREATSMVSKDSVTHGTKSYTASSASYTNKGAAPGLSMAKAPVVDTVRTKRVTRNLTARAESFIRRANNDLHRMLSFFSAQSGDSLYKTAVASKLAAGPAWGAAEGILASPQLRVVIKTWLPTSLDELTEHVTESGRDVADGKKIPTPGEWSDAGVDNAHKDLYLGLYLTTALRELPQMKCAGVCPFCVASCFRGGPGQTLPATTVRYFRDSANVLNMSDKNAETLQAMAERHNQEQHATNGNISEDLKFISEKIMAAKSSFWNFGENRAALSDVTTSIDNWRRHTPVNNMTVTQGTINYFSSIDVTPTMHQWVCQINLTLANPLYVLFEDQRARAGTVSPAVMFNHMNRLVPVAQAGAAHREEADGGGQVPLERTLAPRGAAVVAGNRQTDENGEVGTGQMEDPTVEQEDPLRPPNDVNLRAVEVIQNYRINADHFSWSAVGEAQEERFQHGALTVTDVGVEAIASASDADKATPITGPTRGKVNFVNPGGLPILSEITIETSHERNDWRRPGLKVALYESLRDTDYTAPTGLLTHMARLEPPRRAAYSMRAEDGWDYTAIALTAEAVAYAFAGGEIPIEDGDNWLVTDPKVLFVGLNKARTPSDELAARVCPQLSYPLVGMAEGFSLVHGAAGTTGGGFVRRAGLVDIPSEINKIVFVTTTTYTQNVTVGALDLVVGRYNARDQTIAASTPVDFNDQLEATAMGMLTQGIDLRKTWVRHCMPQVALDWAQVSQEVALLTVAWKADSERQCTTEAAAATCTGTAPHYEDTTVTSIDQPFTARLTARASPHIAIGPWSSRAQMLMAVGVASYTAHNAEQAETIHQALSTANHSHIMRSMHLRKFWEDYKINNGIVDNIVGMAVVTNTQTRAMLHEATSEGGSAYTVVEEVLSRQVRYSWELNRQVQTPITRTGIRTPYCYWYEDRPLEESLKPLDLPDLGFVLGADDVGTVNGRYYPYSQRQYPQSLKAYKAVIEFMAIDATQNTWPMIYADDRRVAPSQWYRTYNPRVVGTLANRAGYNVPTQPERVVGWGLRPWLSNMASNAFQLAIVTLASAQGLSSGNPAPIGRLILTRGSHVPLADITGRTPAALKAGAEYAEIVRSLFRVPASPSVPPSTVPPTEPPPPTGAPPGNAEQSATPPATANAPIAPPLAPVEPVQDADGGAIPAPPN
nr:MAG: capsid protein [Totiviridae sp.]